MKARNVGAWVKSFIFLFLFLCSSATAETRLPEKEETGTLIAAPNPFLKDVNELYVVIEPEANSVGIDGLFWMDLQAMVESTLKQAGYKIAPGIALGKGLRDREIPELRITMELLKFNESQVFVYRIQTAFAGKVKVAEHKLYCKAELWRTEPVMKSVESKAMSLTVTNAILEQVRAFIVAQKASESLAEVLSDEDSNSPASVVNGKKETRRARKMEASKEEYIASKNSKVFHKADCLSAKRISAENLVNYSTREEAIGAGKRPCRQCKS